MTWNQTRKSPLHGVLTANIADDQVCFLQVPVKHQTNLELIDPVTGRKTLQSSIEVTRDEVEDYYGDDGYWCECYAWNTVQGSSNPQHVKSTRAQIEAACKSPFGHWSSFSSAASYSSSSSVLFSFTLPPSFVVVVVVVLSILVCSFLLFIISILLLHLPSIFCCCCSACHPRLQLLTLHHHQ